MSNGDQFSRFVRERRKALRLTLRAFCRQNGFDAANISRIERGKARPPKSQALLESYAMALRLEPETADWNKFFALAAASTGRIPHRILESPLAATRLPEFLRGLSAGTGHRNWVRAVHLENWAECRDAQALLPQLIRRLVLATGNEVTFHVPFPSDEGIHRPGFDGVVEAAGHDEFVPQGTSVWELSTNARPSAKARSDLRKRSRQNQGVNRSSTAFVFATPRKIPVSGNSLQNDRRYRGWKEVRIYDSAMLEAWLECAPAVDVWLAHHIGIATDGLKSIDDHWADLVALTATGLKPDLFLTGRSDDAERLLAWIADDQPRQIFIVAFTPTEAVDFAVAAMRQSMPNNTSAVRTLIVTTDQAWNNVVLSSGRLVLIADPRLALGPEAIAAALRRGHHVITALPRPAPNPREPGRTIVLSRVARWDMYQALRACGVDDEAAQVHATQSGGSLAVLKRRLGTAMGTPSALPSWSHSTNSGDLVPLLLAGGWQESHACDRKALVQLANREYEQIQRIAQRWLHDADPPFLHALGCWRTVSRDDAWWLLASAIGPEDFERFLKVVFKVLGNNGAPRVARRGNRVRLNRRAARAPYSEELKTGLAETLCLIASRSETVHRVSDAAPRAQKIVQQLLMRATWKRWVWLADQLPLLAEAAPEEFLDAVDYDLESKKPHLMWMFEESAGGPHSYTVLLAALEVLAWSRDYFSRASLALARLAERLPRDQPRNSPLESLRAIFTPWMPQTTVGANERLELLRKIARNHPEIGWRLLREFFTATGATTSRIQRPAFRDWAAGWRPITISAHEEACASLLVEFAGQDVDRWIALIEVLENLPGPASSEFVDKLQEIMPGALEPERRRRLADALRGKIGWLLRWRHETRESDHPELKRLHEALNQLEPDDAIERSARLFDHDWQVIETLGLPFDHEHQQVLDQLGQRRLLAIRDVLKDGGLKGILQLANEAPVAELVGHVLAKASGETFDRQVLPSLLCDSTSNVAAFARGFARARFQVGGHRWVNALLNDQWTAPQRGELVLAMPFSPETWLFAGQHGTRVETHYWTNVTVPAARMDAEKVAVAARNLLRHGRPIDACNVLARAIRDKQPPDSALLLEALEKLAAEANGRGQNDSLHRSGHDMACLFRELHRRLDEHEAEVQHDRLADLEWHYLRMLRGVGLQPRVLHERLCSDPARFIELLALVYPHEQEAGDSQQANAQWEGNASHGYTLLRKWNRVPGTRPDGAIDDGALLDWARRARDLATRRNLQQWCDYWLGHVLASTPRLPDSTWPAIPVRDALEELACEALDEGFVDGALNQRGAYHRNPASGGNQEREIGERFRRDADDCATDWDHTAKLLRRIADCYAREAAREDARRERDL